MLLEIQVSLFVRFLFIFHSFHFCGLRLNCFSIICVFPLSPSLSLSLPFPPSLSSTLPLIVSHSVIHLPLRTQSILSEFLTNNFVEWTEPRHPSHCPLLCVLAVWKMHFRCKRLQKKMANWLKVVPRIGGRETPKKCQYARTSFGNRPTENKHLDSITIHFRCPFILYFVLHAIVIVHWITLKITTTAAGAAAVVVAQQTRTNKHNKKRNERTQKQRHRRNVIARLIF